MNIALIGYGRMGRELERVAISRGHGIGLIIDKENPNDLNKSNLENIDVAIDFSVPDQALSNIIKCLNENVHVVSGTTGWLKDMDDAIEAALTSKAAFLYASNFSIGVNIIFYLNRVLARIMSGREDYKPSIEEIHHIKKLDAPSGTALNLAKGIIENHKLINDWIAKDASVDKESTGDKNMLSVYTRREGEVPGTHTVSWDSDVDFISLHHTAKGREGFALGAVLAAEFLIGKSGFLTMSDMLGF